jgi:hypothetical protein
VAGASQGEGLGNKFLANIRETNAVLMMVRCFDDPNVIHVSGSVDPMRDIDIIELELALADLETAEKRVKKAQGAAKTGSKEGKVELALAEKVHAHLTAGKAARTLALSDDDKKQVATFGLLTMKPVLYCCNVGEADLPRGNAWSDTVRARAQTEGAGVVILCGKVEAELAELAAEDRAELLAAYGLKEPALASLARECYRLLGLQSYFTAGERDPRVTSRSGATAPRAAGVIHRLREGLHPRAGLLASTISRSTAPQGRQSRSKRPASCTSRARTHRSGRRHHAVPCSTCDARADAAPSMVRADSRPRERRAWRARWSWLRRFHDRDLRPARHGGVASLDHAAHLGCGDGRCSSTSASIARDEAASRDAVVPRTRAALAVRRTRSSDRDVPGVLAAETPTIARSMFRQTAR